MRILTVALPAALVVTTAAVLLPIAGQASSHDFDDVVSAVEHHYSAHAQRVPMMGFVSLCAHVASGGGVQGMKIAEIDNLPASSDPDELQTLVSQALGSQWKPFVTYRSSTELSMIYVQPNGSAMRMLIADYEHGELDVVRMELNGERLAHWVHDPEGSAHHHDYGTGEKGSVD
jgi:hypothetical protein